MSTLGFFLATFWRAVFSVSRCWSRAVLLTLLAWSFQLSSVLGDLVYDNTLYVTNQLGNARNYRSSDEIGDEIILGGTARLVTDFTFSYASVFTNRPLAAATVRFYANDGPDGDPGTRTIRTPGSLLYESDPFSIRPTVTGFNEVSIRLPGVLVPDTFTWTVEFFNIGADEAGLIFGNGPGPGRSFNDFWRRQNGAWTGLAVPDPGLRNNFVAQVIAQRTADAPLEPPVLTFRRIPNQSYFELRWSSAYTNCVVEAAAALPVNHPNGSLSSPSWESATNRVFLSGSRWVVEIPLNSPQTVYRLRCP